MKHATSVLDEISPDCRLRLECFADLLRLWNERISLVSRADAAEIWTRHIVDSAQLNRLLPANPGPFIDLGSGAGFPGLVLSLVSGRAVHLVEADQRKAAFLREATRVTGAVATVHAVRAEALRLPRAGLVVARALAPLAQLLALAEPLLCRTGVCLFPKGRTVDDELTAAANRWHMHVERFGSETSPDATILRISEIHRAGPTS